MVDPNEKQIQAAMNTLWEFGDDLSDGYGYYLDEDYQDGRDDSTPRDKQHAHFRAIATAIAKAVLSACAQKRLPLEARTVHEGPGSTGETHDTFGQKPRDPFASHGAGKNVSLLPETQPDPLIASGNDHGQGQVVENDFSLEGRKKGRKEGNKDARDPGSVFQEKTRGWGV